MKFLLFILASIPLLASNLLTYNIYERNDRVDIMLSFDSPYEGGISQQSEAGATVLMLGDLVSEEEIEKSINSQVLQGIFITQQDPETARVELRAQEPITITASKTADRFGLRIRVTKLGATRPQTSAQTQAIQTRPETDVNSKFLIVVGILIALFIFLIVVKRKVNKKVSSNLKNNFNPNVASGSNLNYNTSANSNLTSNTSSLKSVASDFGLGLNGDVKILFERGLDEKNKVVLFEYDARKYLVLTGSSNVLLDKFGEDKINDKEDFEVFFEENKQKLERYLQDRRNSLNSYKDNLSRD